MLSIILDQNVETFIVFKKKKSRTGPGANSVVQNLSSTNVVIDLFLRKVGRNQSIVSLLVSLRGPPASGIVL